MINNEEDLLASFGGGTSLVLLGSNVEQLPLTIHGCQILSYHPNLWGCIAPKAIACFPDSCVSSASTCRQSARDETQRSVLLISISNIFHCQCQKHCSSERAASLRYKFHK